MTHHPAKTLAHQPHNTADALAEIRGMISACMQCGTCSASCPQAAFMEFTPRRLWRLVQMERHEEIFQSRTFALCSACYCCTLRCPRGLPLTEAMAALKRLGARQDAPGDRCGHRFHHSFLASVRRHGRVQELAFMTGYFAAMHDPLLPLRFTGLGLRLLGKGKLRLRPRPEAGLRLDALFRRVQELEEMP
jgi:heterodisulfide reductase subunit C